MSLLCLKPCDNTFWGDGKQFDFGMSNIITSKYTPYPSVFFGAIFTALLSKNDEFRNKFFELGKYDHEQILKINQVYLYNEKSKKVYIKAPLDLFVKSKKEKAFGKFEKINDNIKSSLTSYKMIMYSPINKNYIRATDQYISINNIYDAYLKQQVSRIHLKSETEIFSKNYKVGIKIDKKTKNVEEGKLYKLEQIEFKDNNWSYIVDYHIDYSYLERKYKNINIDYLENGFLKLGGENKVCKYKDINNLDIEKFILAREESIKNIKSKKLKIIFSSEAYFGESITEAFNNIGIEILGISNDKPIYIGGHNMENNKSRIMYKGYTSGTVILANIINKESMENGLKNYNAKGFNKFIIMEDDF